MSPWKLHFYYRASRLSQLWMCKMILLLLWDLIIKNVLLVFNRTNIVTLTELDKNKSTLGKFQLSCSERPLKISSCESIFQPNAKEGLHQQNACSFTPKDSYPTSSHWCWRKRYLLIGQCFPIFQSLQCPQCCKCSAWLLEVTGDDVIASYFLVQTSTWGCKGRSEAQSGREDISHSPKTVQGLSQPSQPPCPPLHPCVVVLLPVAYNTPWNTSQCTVWESIA